MFRADERNFQPFEKKIMSTEVKDIVESFNIAKFISQYEEEARHPFFDPYRTEIEDFSRVCYASWLRNSYEF